MTATKDLATVLADYRERVTILHSVGESGKAQIIEDFADEVQRAAEPFITFLPEADAMLRSGKSREWFRSRFQTWERDGLARANPNRPRERQYRRCIVPRRLNEDAVRADAEREARGESAA